MKKQLVSAAVLAATSMVAGVTQAAPISLPGDSPIYFQFNNMEQVDQSGTNSIAPSAATAAFAGDVAPTISSEGNWGVFNVSSLQAGGIATNHQDISGGPAFWANGISGGQISGIFYGINLTSGTTATGGYMDIYWNDTAVISNADLNGAYLPTNRTDANHMGIFTPATGTFLARLAFQSGIISGDNTTTIQSNSDLTLTTSGHADSFASVVDANGDGVIDAADGAWASVLNTDWFYVDTNGDGTFGGPGETRDLRFSNFFNGLTAWNDTTNTSIVGLRSNDPGRAFTVPEPSEISLLGIGLLGLGAFARRRKVRNA
jgi:hypothetical protein